jgi:S1-C subfamily serine protease
MKFARLFLASLAVCIVLSGLSAYLMIRFLVDTVGSDTAFVLSQKPVSTPSVPVAAPLDPSLTGLESGVKSIASQVSPSVVSIVITREVQTYRTDPYGFFYEPAGTVRKKVGGGTGFFVSKDGYILTNKHVVSDPKAEYTIILADGRELIGKVLAYDPTTDLAVIRAFADINTPYF